jgi:hypothetical protein
MFTFIIQKTMVSLVNKASSNKLQITYLKHHVIRMKEMMILKYQYVIWKIVNLSFAWTPTTEVVELSTDAQHIF